MDLKSIFLPLSAFLSQPFPLKALAGLTGHKLICPCYHTVSDEPLDHIRYLYSAPDRKKFIADLDFLLQHYTPLSLQDLISVSKGKRTIDKNYFFLSFDDGFCESFHLIAPILLSKGIPATFFLNPDFLDNKEMLFRCKASLLCGETEKKKLPDSLFAEIKKCFHEECAEFSGLKKSLLEITYGKRYILDKLAKLLGLDFNAYLAEKQPYLTTSQVRNLLQQGFTLGGHSMNHPEYRLIPIEEQILQTEECIQWIREQFNIPCNAFAFPFTDFGVTKKFFDEIYSRGIADISFGAAGIKNDYSQRHFHRIPMDHRDNHPLSAGNLIRAEYFYYILKKPFGKNRIVRT